MSVTPAFSQRALNLLAPLFLNAPDDDLAQAREGAKSSLDNSAARNDRELRAAVLAIAFTIGALQSLVQSLNPANTVAQTTRLRASANALGRAAMQHQTRLDKLQKDLPNPTAQAADALDEALDLPAGSSTDDLIAFVRSQIAAIQEDPAQPAPLAAPLNRQQRRAEERRLEKIRRRQEEQDRRAEHTAARAA